MSQEARPGVVIILVAAALAGVAWIQARRILEHAEGFDAIGGAVLHWVAIGLAGVALLVAFMAWRLRSDPD